jgi:anaerobic ribonucleoside-triphosphate reductase
MEATIKELCEKEGISEESAREIFEICGRKIKPEVKKTVIPTEIYSRVCGYFRPVQQWNNGKREEFNQRKHFNIKAGKILNREVKHETPCSDR